MTQGARAQRWSGLIGLVGWLWLLCGAPAAQAEVEPAHVLTVQGAIGPASADYVLRGLQRAQQAGAPLVVLRLDTPGGLDTAMRQMIQAILGSSVPVVTYVGPEGARAASAGTYILYASHVAAMAPATTLGAATPVAIGMPGLPGRTPPASAPAASAPVGGDALSRKQLNDAASFIRGLAQRHGRNAEWAERAVREAVTLTSSEALREGVIDVVAADLPALLTQIDGRSVRVPGGSVTLKTAQMATRDMPPDARHRLLSVIANPSFALILMMIGIYGLMFEFSSPGFGVPGTVGAICLLLAMFALQMLPVNYAGLALILLGMGLLAAELLSPSFGVLGVGGVVAFIAGGLLLFDRDVPGMGVPLALIFGLAASSAAAVLLGGSMALRARRAPVVSGRESLVGAAGVIERLEGDVAWARVQGERWRVRMAVTPSPGQAVRITAIDGLVLDAEPAAQKPSPPGGTS